MKYKIKDLVFEKSFDGNFDCFSGRYNGRFITGSNESGEFSIGNYKNVNLIIRISLETEIEERFKL